jgi:hypothetical protein
MAHDKQKRGAKGWHDHAQKHQKHLKTVKPREGEVVSTPTQQKLVKWAEKHPDPTTDKAIDELRLLGFDAEHPPVPLT